MNLEKLALTFVAAAMIVCFGQGSAALGQNAKDRKTLDELETRVRRDFDELAAKYRPPNPKKAAAVTPAPLAWTPPPPSSSYDKFKDITTVQVTTPLYHPITEPKLTAGGSLRGTIAHIDIIATYSYTGQMPVSPSTVTLIFKTISSGSSFFGPNPSFIVLADGKRIVLDNMVQSIRYEGAPVEYEAINVPIQPFLQIINADVVEAQIGQFDFPIPDLQINAFRALLSLPQRPASEPSKVQPIAETSKLRLTDVAGSTWQGANFTLAFQRGGIASLMLPRERPGTWVQTGDKVELEFPYIDFDAVRGLGVGVIKDDTLVVEIKFFGLFGGARVVEVFKRKE